MSESSQRELKSPGTLLDSQGNLTDIGWARQPLLGCNLENARFYSPLLRFWQPMRMKRWDYYGITTPTHFFSFTISDVGYLGSIFAYVIEFKSGHYHEETLSIPLAKGVQLPCNSNEGISLYDNGKVKLQFESGPLMKKIYVKWSNFYSGDLEAEIELALKPEHESMAIVIPIEGKRFYYNRKVNCIPAEGWVKYNGQRIQLDPKTCLGNFDWGRGIWLYKSFWVWASASGFLHDRRRIGLNLGFGFGDTSAATENCIILNGHIHKLGLVEFKYNNRDFKAPWKMKSPDGRLDLIFTPFFERAAKTDLKILSSEVHQLFGHYHGSVVLDDGEVIEIEDLVGWAEEHHAKW